MRIAILFASFYVGWFACVLGGARGYGLAGALVGLLIAIGLVVLSSQPRHCLRITLVASILGWGLDLIQINFGMISLHEPLLAGVFLPAWLSALWVLFSATLVDVYRFLFDRLALAAALGFVFGPLSYLAGAGLGAVDLHPQTWPSLLSLGVQWGVFFPVALKLASRPTDLGATESAV